MFHHRDRNWFDRSIESKMTDSQRKALDKEVLRYVKRTRQQVSVGDIEQGLRQEIGFPFDEFDVEDSLWRLSKARLIVFKGGKAETKRKGK